MSHKHLSTYLNDHLSGATAGVDLLNFLEGEAAQESALTVGLAEFARALRREVSEDKGELERIMATLEVARSAPRQAAGWLGDKLAYLKLRMDDPADGPLRLQEALESLALGVQGKRLLWLALSTAAQDSPALRITDYERLIQRAEDQFSRIEARRQEVAAVALAVAEWLSRQRSFQGA